MSFNWEEALADLERRRAIAHQMGGPEKVGRQHKGGRLTIRERIGSITEDFREIGEFPRFPERSTNGEHTDTLPASYVCGLGSIDGRAVAIGGEDFTVRAGTPGFYLDRLKGGMGGFVEDLAYEYKIPLVLFLEGVGGDVTAQDEKGHAFLVSSWSWKRCYDLLPEVPVLTAVLGAAAGGTGGRAVLSHFSVISKGSVMFAGGPPVVKRSLGMNVTKEELGAAEIHTDISGAIDNLAEDEPDALDQIKRALSYLPQ